MSFGQVWCFEMNAFWQVLSAELQDKAQPLLKSSCQESRIQGHNKTKIANFCYQLSGWWPTVFVRLLTPLILYHFSRNVYPTDFSFLGVCCMFTSNSIWWCTQCSSLWFCIDFVSNGNRFGLLVSCISPILTTIWPIHPYFMLIICCCLCSKFDKQTFCCLHKLD